MKTALWILKRIYKPGYDYQKAGVMLTNLSSAKAQQIDLFVPNLTNESSKLMSVMDAVNNKMGKSMLRIATQGFKAPWKMKQENKSPCYTTDWNALICVK